MDIFLTAFGTGLLFMAALMVWTYGGAFVLRFGVPLIFYAAVWLARCFGLSALYGSRGIAIAGQVAFRGLSAAGLFLILLFDEWRRGGEFGDDHDDDHDDDDADHAAYDAAVSLLGLSQDFTQTDLNRAYKISISRAHPDRGGSHEQAQAVNTARDVVRRIRGWT